MSYTIWFTGLSGSGKTTIAQRLTQLYHFSNKPLLFLDGDVVRELVNKDLQYSLEEREQHLKRIVGISVLANLSYIPVIVSTISPTKKIRDFARNSLERYIEVYAKCPIEICRQRDPKGLYKKKTTSMVGVDIVYEEPENPDIILETDKLSVEKCVDKVLKGIKWENIYAMKR